MPLAYELEVKCQKGFIKNDSISQYDSDHAVCAYASEHLYAQFQEKTMYPVHITTYISGKNSSNNVKFTVMRVWYSTMVSCLPSVVCSETKIQLFQLKGK